MKFELAYRLTGSGWAECVLSDAANQVLEEHGEAGYLERWMEHPFPMTQLAELARVLKASYRLG
jgi:hypothetical protein